MRQKKETAISRGILHLSKFELQAGFFLLITLLAIVYGRNLNVFASVEKDRLAASTTDKGSKKPTGACAQSSNLIVNNDAEADPAVTGDGVIDHDVSNWENEIGAFTVIKYGAVPDFPTISGPGPENRGTFFFGGGRSSFSSASQIIDISNCAEQIDINGQQFILSGFLGGFSGDNDQVQVNISFRNSTNTVIGTSSIGPVTASDRANITGLLLRNSVGIVPTGARSVEITLQMTRFAGTSNDGYADNMSFVLAPPAVCAPLPSNIMSWWKAEGNANDFFDFNNGALQNGTAFSTGFIGQSFNFDGVDDHVIVGRTIQDDFTIEFWMNSTQIITSGGTQWYNGSGLVDAEVNSVTNDFGVSLLNGKVYFGTGNPDVTIISKLVADGNWHHIAATRKRSTGQMRLYIDGSQAAALTGGTQSLTAPPRIVFGRIQVNNNPYQGKLDEISIYDRALTSAEVQTISNAGPYGKCSLSSVQSLNLEPNPVDAGQSSTGTVSLRLPAPVNGAIVELSSDSPYVTVPSDLIVPSGNTSGTFLVQTTIPEVDVTALITASYESDSAAASLTVVAPRSDLVFGASMAPESATTDAAFPINWTINNQGAARTNSSWTDKVFLSTDNQLGSDTLLAEFPFGSVLEPNQTINRIQTISIPANSISTNGQYFLIIKADANNQLNEENENNNVVALPISVTRPSRPDLIVESVVAPNTAFFDQTILVQWTVKNVGNGPTNASDWRDFVFLSVDNVPELEDPLKVPVANVSYLGPGESYTSSAEFRIPRGLAGQYKIIVWTDSDGSNHRTNNWPQRVLEVNEENNFGIAIPIQIDIPTLPDLRASNVVAPEEAFAGGQISLNWQVENDGTGITPNDQVNWQDKIYLSQDTTFNAETDRLVGVRSRSGGLNPNESYSVSNYNITLPNDIAGDRYVFIVADGDNQVYEFNDENNNADYDRVQPGSPMHINATPPDLIISNAVDAPASAQTGQLITVNWNVQNQGAFDAAPSWFDGIYLSADQTLDTENDVLLGSVFRNSSLGPGSNYNATANVATPSCISGSYYLFIVADSRQQIFEYDPKQNAETNNTSAPRAIAISEAASDLAVMSISNPTTGNAGQPLNISWTVVNQGVGPTIKTSGRTRSI
jgi:subtilase family serine protease